MMSSCCSDGDSDDRGFAGAPPRSDQLLIPLGRRVSHTKKKELVSKMRCEIREERRHKKPPPVAAAADEIKISHTPAVPCPSSSEDHAAARFLCPLATAPPPDHQHHRTAATAKPTAQDPLSVSIDDLFREACSMREELEHLASTQKYKVFESKRGHQDDIKLNVKLQHFALVAKQPAFDQLRTVEQLGYITMLMQRNDSGVRGLQFIIQSTVKDAKQLDIRAETFLKMFESKLYEMTDEEFKSNVSALVDMKLEKHKNLREESAFYWREISDGNLKFDRRESEVAALRETTKEDLIEIFNNSVKIDAPRRKSLSVQIYGGLHSAEYQNAVNEPHDPQKHGIKDIFSFRRSRPLYGSFKGGLGQMKL